MNPHLEVEQGPHLELGRQGTRLRELLTRITCGPPSRVSLTGPHPSPPICTKYKAYLLHRCVARIR